MGFLKLFAVIAFPLIAAGLFLIIFPVGVNYFFAELRGLEPQRPNCEIEDYIWLTCGIFGKNPERTALVGYILIVTGILFPFIITLTYKISKKRK